jgi:catechol 2,3-dioxygenase-like lactoylglutathione lyase family enzyme
MSLACFSLGAENLKINRIEHVSINVSNMAASLVFYEQLLGFTRLQTVDCGDFNITYFEVPGGSRLELFDYHGKNQANERTESEVGLRHLAFQVENVSKHEQILKEKGVTITLSTCDLPNLDARVLLFLDPNGVTLEFCERI